MEEDELDGTDEAFEKTSKTVQEERRNPKRVRPMKR
jgi:hypothetical protein